MSNGDSFDLPEYRPGYERIETDLSYDSMYSGIGSIENIDQPSAIQETSSLPGWLNSVANLIPSLTGIVTSLFPKNQTSQPLSQTTKQPATQSVLNGLFPATKTGNSVLGTTTKNSSSNIFLYLIIGGAVLFLIFMKR